MRLAARTFLLAVAASYATWPAVSFASENEASEHTVKAAYLSKFGGFIRWPDTPSNAETSPITICVIGDDPVGPALDQVAGRAVGKRPLNVRRIKIYSPDAGCQILYAGDSNPERVSQILKSTRGSGVLTVTGLEQSTAPPAVINFVIRENHVRFEINEQAASDNGLAISSQLLGLAVSVKTHG